MSKTFQWQSRWLDFVLLRLARLWLAHLWKRLPSRLTNYIAKQALVRLENQETNKG
jgi:hypothetical protein